ncbi:MAG TPA: acyl-CoA dehydrogenase family protein, partial [Candidatus Binataceae bacterium]|nr:acyl-CoA dehydrogenase family protein [Candidatus Binataceae bacterium]
MDFNFSPEDEAFRKNLRAWLEVNAPKGMENSDSFGDEADDTDEWSRRIGWYKKLHQGGWVGIDWPKEYGGRGATVLQSIVYHQELARAKAPLP